MISPDPPDVSIVIKALNESPKIDAAIASACAALAALGPHRGDVVVADGLSSDGTAEQAVRWARHAALRVVQLVHAQDRGCGAGVELGYRWARGRWVLFMDGDMVLQPGFLTQALAYLETHPDVAGVGGWVQDRQIRNGTDRIRQQQGLGLVDGERPWLEGGGLYRRAALQGDPAPGHRDAAPQGRCRGGPAALHLGLDAHAGDPRLAAYEEADLGIRLRRRGWRLRRLPLPAFIHDGHREPTHRVLWARWRSGRAQAAGRLLRLHLGRSGSLAALRLLAHPLGLGGLWLLGLWALTHRSSALTAAFLPGVMGLLALHGLRARSLLHVLTAWADWHLLLAGIVKGLISPMAPSPRCPPSRLLADGPQIETSSRRLKAEGAPT